MEGKTCGNCKHRNLRPYEKPCHDCKEPELKGWEPAPPPDIVYRGLDMGAPEGDKTNVRLDWGERGPEIIGPKVWTDDTESGPVLAVTRMPLETVIGYAIEGIKDRASKIGLKLTDKTLGEHELFDLTHDLANLHDRWVTLETERAAIRKAVEGAKHGKGND